MSNAEDTTKDKGRVYHTKCTGAALATVSRQTKDEDITLFGGCFCPFVQRAWTAFEFLGVPYKVRARGFPILFWSEIPKISVISSSTVCHTPFLTVKSIFPHQSGS